jgi:hypothetical protein
MGLKASDLSKPQSLNRYSYTQNDPVNLVDPGGSIVVAWDCQYWYSYVFNDQKWNVYRCQGTTLGGKKLVWIEEEEQRRRKARFDQARFEKCLKEFFGVEINSFTFSSKGVNGLFTGYGIDMIKNQGREALLVVANDIKSYTGSQLYERDSADRVAMGEKPLPPGGYSMGYTGPPPALNSPYVNYTANDLTNPMAILATQIHELGMSLWLFTGKTPPQQYPGKPPSGDTDVGSKFERCVFGGEVDDEGYLNPWR